MPEAGFLASDTFDSYANVAAVEAIYGAGNVGGLLGSTGRGGSKAINEFLRLDSTILGGEEAVVVGVALVPSTNHLVELWGPNAAHTTNVLYRAVGLSTDGALYVETDAGTKTFIDLDPLHMFNVWRYLEVQYRPGDGVGEQGYLHLAVEGNRVYDVYGATGMPTGITPEITIVLIRGRIDDLYVRVPRALDYLGNPIDYDDTGANKADFVGDYRHRATGALDPSLALGDGTARVDQQYLISAIPAPKITARVSQQWIIVALGGDSPPPDPPPPAFPPTIPTRGGRVFLDSFLEYDGRDAAAIDGLYPLSAVGLFNGVTWAAGEPLTMSTGSAMFTTALIGHQYFLHAPDGSAIVRFTITSISSPTVAMGVSDIDIPLSMQAVALDVWDIAVSVVTGLSHLEGKDVGIVGDGLVLANPLHPGITVRTVSGGQVELGGWYAHVYVGLPYVADLETLDIDTPSGPSLKPQAMNVTKVGVVLDDSPSRGLYAASAPPPDDGYSVTGMQELRQPSASDYNDAVTEYIDVNTSAAWNRHGRVFLRDLDPVLLTVLAIIPNGYLPPSG